MKVLIAIALIAAAYSVATYNPMLHKVQSGERVLVCNGTIINPERVIDFVDATWIFDNGYASNCEVK